MDLLTTLFACAAAVIAVPALHGTTTTRTVAGVAQARNSRWAHRAVWLLAVLHVASLAVTFCGVWAERSAAIALCTATAVADAALIIIIAKQLIQAAGAGLALRLTITRLVPLAIVAALVAVGRLTEKSGREAGAVDARLGPFAAPAAVRHLQQHLVCIATVVPLLASPALETHLLNCVAAVVAAVTGAARAQQAAAAKAPAGKRSSADDSDDEIDGSGGNSDTDTEPRPPASDADDNGQGTYSDEEEEGDEEGQAEGEGSRPQGDEAAPRRPVRSAPIQPHAAISQLAVLLVDVCVSSWRQHAEVPLNLRASLASPEKLKANAMAANYTPSAAGAAGTATVTAAPAQLQPATAAGGVGLRRRSVPGAVHAASSSRRTAGVRPDTQPARNLPEATGQGIAGAPEPAGAHASMQLAPTAMTPGLSYRPSACWDAWPFQPTIAEEVSGAERSSCGESPLSPHDPLPPAAPSRDATAFEQPFVPSVPRMAAAGLPEGFILGNASNLPPPTAASSAGSHRRGERDIVTAALRYQQQDASPAGTGSAWDSVVPPTTLEQRLAARQRQHHRTAWAGKGTGLSVDGASVPHMGWAHLLLIAWVWPAVLLATSILSMLLPPPAAVAIVNPLLTFGPMLFVAHSLGATLLFGLQYAEVCRQCCIVMQQQADAMIAAGLLGASGGLRAGEGAEDPPGTASDSDDVRAR